MNRITKAAVLVLSFLGGVAVSWELNSEAEKQLRATVKLMVSVQIEDIDKLSGIRKAMQSAPPSEPLIDADRLLVQDIVRHVLLLSALEPKAAQLENKELTALCQIGNEWEELQVGSGGQSLFAIASTRIQSLKKTVQPEIKKRQNVGGGTGCVIEGVEPWTRDALQKHPLLKK